MDNHIISVIIGFLVFPERVVTVKKGELLRYNLTARLKSQTYIGIERHAVGSHRALHAAVDIDIESVISLDLEVGSTLKSYESLHLRGYLIANFAPVIECRDIVNACGYVPERAAPGSHRHLYTLVYLHGEGHMALECPENKQSYLALAQV